MVERTTPAAVRSAFHMSRSLRVPLFPLPGAILFPRSQLPLHIFEPRYREMVRDAIDGGGRIAMIQPHRLDDDNRAPLYQVGCVGELVGVEELEDGRFNIVLLGSSRFRLIKEAEVDASYRCADINIEAFDDQEPEPLSLVQRAEVEREARRLGDAMGLAVDWEAVSRLDDEMLVNAIAQVAPFDVGAKQALLEEPLLDGRADLLVQLMQFHRMAVTGGIEIEPTLQ
jgi:Lon protease-like protein